MRDSMPRSERRAAFASTLLALLLSLFALTAVSADDAAYQLSYEAIPSTRIDKPTPTRRDYARREAFARAVLDKIVPRVFDALALDDAQARTHLAPGGYLGKTSVSLQCQWPGTREQTERVAAALGYVLRQQSVLISQPRAPGEGSALVRVAFARAPPDARLAQRFFEHAGKVDAGLLGGYTAVGDELWFINLRDAQQKPYSGLDDQRFAQALREATASFRRAKTRVAGVDGVTAWLVDNDWTARPQGEAYLARLPNDAALRARLLELRQQHQALTEETARRERWP